MVVLDTDFLIALLQRDARAIKKLEQLEATGGSVAVAYTTTVNVAELYKGVYRSTNREKEASKVKQLLDSLELLVLDQESARLVGELDAVTKSNAIGDLDLMIASIAMSNEEVIVTKNVKHFQRIPDLKVETW
jgi:tRNA(fMet)-specific endonuclease VapC